MDTLFIILAGLFGSTSMIIALKVFQLLGWKHTDMEEAIGSIITKKLESSYYTGVIVHYGLGIVFAFLYAGLLSIMPLQTLGPILVLSAVFGIGHGIVAILLLIMIISQYHPLPKFKDAGVEVAFGHLFGHIVYAITVGFFLSFTQVQNKNENQSVLMGIPSLDAFSFVIGLTLLFGVILIPLFALLHKKYKNLRAH